MLIKEPVTMKTLLIPLLAIVVVLHTLPAFAQSGPIARQATVLASASAAPAAAPKTRMKNSGMYVGGIAVAGLGGGLLGYGLSMEHGAVCLGLYFIACEEYGANKTMYILSGAALAGAGITLSYLGSRRVEVAPAPSLTGAIVRYNVLGESNSRRHGR